MPAAYTPGSIPDASDSTMTSFDQLTAQGISYNEAAIQVPWERVDAPGQKMLGGREGEVVQTAGFKKLNKVGYYDANNWLFDRYANDNPQFSNMQQKLAAAGFMGKNPNFTQGTPDTLTQGAWQEVLKIASASDKTPFEIIDDAIERQGGFDEALKKHNVGRNGQVVPDISLMHPDDIKMTAKAVSRQVLGIGWDDAQLDRFVASFQAQQKAAQAAAQGSGATYTDAPSVQAAAAEAARNQNPVAAEATDWDNAANMMQEAFKMLSGGGE